MNRNILSNKSCSEDWKNMSNNESGRLCLKCKIRLTDLTKLTIEEIAKNHYGKGKCVGLTNDQIDFITNYKRIKNIVLASSLFIGTTFLNVTYGQINDNRNVLLQNSNHKHCKLMG